MNIIRATDRTTTPWKNGGGSTTEIAAEPAGASLDTFDWRISMAQIAVDGPFSEFLGIDRTLSVVKGIGLSLKIGDNAPVTLDRRSGAISFAGELATSAQLTSGEITDLNVMTRRQRFSHRVRRVWEPASHDFDGADIAVVLSLNEGMKVTTEKAAATLGPGDAAILLRPNDVRFRMVPRVSSVCYLVLLYKKPNLPYADRAKD
ncbi:HutD family protein [Bradyrhizobium sp. CCGUVB23]|uniref:HutD/Ves family protein n=1 Tax=Bradyrhizobium sp. CCGUVB23 TaxID=2949630 RepID=UPI0020B3572F|nr:HutD family protein [Bradyrhizobium sp. CCGUVB23]MCP3461039.1 HutD family protein [Bradyrhizobium sp. CCGUVB23]